MRTWLQLLLAPAVLTSAVASGVGHPSHRTSQDYFATLINPITKEVASRYGNASTVYSVIEVDACRFDPKVHVHPDGCMGMEPMQQLDDIGFLRILYTPGTPTHGQCGPSVEVWYDVAQGNHTFTFHTGPGGDVVGDVCNPIGVGNSTRLTANAALALATKKAGKFEFFTLNFREILYPCISEPTMVFTLSESMSSLFVGVDTTNVCRTAVTQMYTLPNGSIPPICEQPDRLPDCYH